MFDHVTIRASDRDASEAFYDTVLHPLGIEKANSGEEYAEWADFSLARAESATTPGTTARSCSTRTATTSSS